VFANGEKFRLANVRSPEKRQKGGSTATRVLAGMLGRSKNKAKVTSVARDKYGRTVVNMSNKDGSINKRMRGKGYTNQGK
jgi:endonuclease YncB( thermonuclease family)